MNFDGVWTPLVTPFDDSGAVQTEVLVRLIDMLIDQGVHGLIFGGTTGEYYALSREQRFQTFDIATRHARGRIPIMAGINATTTKECLVLGQYARDAGFDAVLVPAPYYCQPTQEELLEHFERVDDALDMPIMLYNYPDRTGVPMSFEFIQGLKSRPNVQAIKESTGSISRMHELLNGYTDQLQISCGMDDQVLEYFAWGASSWVGGASNFLAPEHVALYQACVIEKDFVKGRELAAGLLPVLNILEQGGKFCQHIKYGCELAGLPVGPARAPLMTLRDDEKEHFKRIYEQLVSQRR